MTYIKNIQQKMTRNNKVAGYKMNTQKSFGFYKQSIDTKKHSFIIALKRKKCLEVNLRGEEPRHYKTVSKEIKEDIKKWKHILST